MKRSRSTWTALLAVTAATLLAAGWIAASVRDQRARDAIERMHSREVLRAAERAIVARVEELRSRESERPFYLYSHYFIPPDLLTISDAIAISPLATPTPTPPIVGWFQVDPDGTIRTPLSPDPPRNPTGLEARLVHAASSAAIRSLRDSIGDRSAGALAARVRSTPVTAAAAPAMRRARPRVPTQSADAPVPVPVALNLQANALANDIQRANAGDFESFQRATSSNQAPIVAQIVQQSSGAIPQQQSVPQLQRATTLRPTPARPRPRVIAPRPPPPAIPTVPAEVEVHYAPMRWLDGRATDDAWLLARIVSSRDERESSAVVQGAVVDRASLVTVLQRAARRASIEGRRVELVQTARGCALVRTNPSFPPGVLLCLRESSRAAFRADQARAMRVDFALVALLVSAVAFALVALARIARREAELADRRRDFVSAVSHELRTPLTTLRMHAEMLQEGLVDAERAPRVFAELVNESTRMTRLVENVLEASRLEAGKHVVAATDGDVRTSVARIVEAQRSMTEAAGMRVVLVDGGALPMRFDQSALERILANLLDNATKYAREATDARIEVSVEPSEQGALLRVRDYGPGIPARDAEAVFERFHRVVRATDAHRPGTGLGLSLVRELARAHGGDACIDTKSTPGATVVVTLARLP